MTLIGNLELYYREDNMEQTLQDILRKVFTGKATEEDEQYYIDHFMNKEEKQIGKPIFKMNKEENLQYQILMHNNRQGELIGYDCPKCKNRGNFAIKQEGYFALTTCDCMSLRRTIRLMERSGLGNLLKLYSFDKFECKEEWQKHIYEKARAFVNDDKNWFYIGGNSGSGKSHLCTAIVRELLNKDYQTKYMLWLDESVALKQAITDAERYAKLMDEIKNAQVLYIDDFLKTGKNEEPTQADIKLAMEILNYRYNKARSDRSRRWITIISSERSIGEILEYDEATGSRITEMTKPDYYLFIAKDQSKNYRLK